MFSVLTSKIFGGLAAVLLLALAVTVLTWKVEVRSLTKSLKAEREVNVALRLNNATLKGNVSSLEGGLAQCNAGVDSVAARAQTMNRAGVIAIDAARKTGAAVAVKLRQIDAAPATTCEDAFNILKNGARP